MNECSDAYKEFAITMTQKQLCAGGKNGVDLCSGGGGKTTMQYSFFCQFNYYNDEQVDL